MRSDKPLEPTTMALTRNAGQQGRDTLVITTASGEVISVRVKSTRGQQVSLEVTASRSVKFRRAELEPKP